MSKRILYRSGKNRILAGVCGGIAEYFDIEPAIIRLVVVLFALAGGAGVVAYIAAWIIIPEDPEFKKNDVKMNTKVEIKKDKDSEEGLNIQGKSAFFGLLLMVIGAIFLANNFFPSFRLDKYWPIIPIGVGLAMIFSGYKKK